MAAGSATTVAVAVATMVTAAACAALSASAFAASSFSALQRHDSRGNTANFRDLRQCPHPTVQTHCRAQASGVPVSAVLPGFGNSFQRLLFESVSQLGNLLVKVCCHLLHCLADLRLTLHTRYRHTVHDGKQFDSEILPHSTVHPPSQRPHNSAAYLLHSHNQAGLVSLQLCNGGSERLRSEMQLRNGEVRHSMATHNNDTPEK